MEAAEIHQMEGFDSRKRMFNRNIFVHKKDRNYSVQFTYEGLFLESPHFSTPAEAIKELVKTVQGKGFSRLRTRLNFKGKRYLTELEPWVDF
jgi:hypothetical protein